MKFLLTSFATPDYGGGCFAHSRPTFVGYAEKWGYVYQDVPLGELQLHRDAYWWKYDSLLWGLERQPDFVVFLDADCMVLNPEVSLESLVSTYMPPHVDALVTHDWNGICDCVVILRNTAWSKSAVRTGLWVGPVRGHEFQHAQGVFKWLLELTPEHQHKIAFLPTTVVGNATIRWRPKTWVYHFSLDGRNGASRFAEVAQAILENRLDDHMAGLPGMPHGIEYP